MYKHKQLSWQRCLAAQKIEVELSTNLLLSHQLPNLKIYIIQLFKPENIQSQVIQKLLN